jgi:hypothetical protein
VDRDRAFRPPRSPGFAALSGPAFCGALFCSRQITFPRHAETQRARLNVGVVGATGLVGSMMRELLVEREFPVATLRLFASSRSEMAAGYIR